jgi:hypothetical protein
MKGKELLFYNMQTKEIWIDGGLLWSVPPTLCGNSSTIGWYLLERSLYKRAMN